MNLSPQTELPVDAESAAPRKGWGIAARELIETLILTLVVFLLIRFALPNFRIEGFSMEPNFHDGQYLFVNKLEYFLHPPERGDVIVFLPPTSNTRDFIKRVIGLPGERVEIIEGLIYINGVKLDEPYPLNAGTYSYGPATLGEDEFFVLGDNRNNSSDSHSWGMLVEKKIIGKAWISYWPPQLIGVVPTYTYAAGK
ncbi:MAG: signal peptidase I [Chloroflexi bacterium]|nr:signal peptidase I [Chloroflexota bacterium]MBI3740590.1 signal peptidase I [Chloroflexota bacterium]